MKSLKYIVYKEDKYYVSQCLNVDVSSFGNTLQEAVDNLNEALELYFDDKTVIVPSPRKEIPIGTFRSIVRQSGLSTDDFK